MWEVYSRLILAYSIEESLPGWHPESGDIVEARSGVECVGHDGSVWAQHFQTWGILRVLPSSRRHDRLWGRGRHDVVERLERFPVKLRVGKADPVAGALFCQ